YPLRPETVESIYYLHQATGDPVYLSMGADILSSLESINRAPCGFAATRNVETRLLEDR
ncbi:glycoside hydrolase, partial [Baffinella frigidus]